MSMNIRLSGKMEMAWVIIICDMAQCEDEYINEMHGIQRERDNNNKSRYLKNDT
jgi:hypothetical protein